MFILYSEEIGLKQNAKINSPLIRKKKNKESRERFVIHHYCDNNKDNHTSITSLSIAVIFVYCLLMFIHSRHILFFFELRFGNKSYVIIEESLIECISDI